MVQKSIVISTDDPKATIEEYEQQGYELISIAPDTWEEYTDHEDHTYREATSFLCHFKKIIKEAKQ
jgi:hypothetical protein